MTSGIWMMAGRLTGMIPSAAAAKAPTYNCPSAPMFQNLALKATATAIPVNARGAIFTNVSSTEKLLPNEPEKMRNQARKGLTPAMIMRIEERSIDNMIAYNGSSIFRHHTSGGRRCNLIVIVTSLLIVFLIFDPGHKASDFGSTCTIPVEDVHDASFIYDSDPIA